MSENIDINIAVIKEEVSINAANNLIQVNINTAPISIINPQNYDLSQFTNTSPNPFVRTSGLAGYVPTSRTLTINGVTQDLSADRTYTIATGLTVGTTPIASGTVGRVLFEGTGNVLQESANLFWDSTNNRLGVGTEAPTNQLTLNNTLGSVDPLKINVLGNGGISIERAVTGGIFALRVNSGGKGVMDCTTDFALNTGGSPDRLVVKANGNVLIGTTTDGGFKFDVNGTARVQGNTTISAVNPLLTINNTSSGLMGLELQNAGATQAYTGIASAASAAIVGSLTNDYYIRSVNRRIILSANNGGAIQAMLFSTGNFAINTTTDAGFRLDVNGTARVQTSLAVTTGKTFSTYQSGTIVNDALKLTVSTDGAVFGIQNSNALGFSGIEYLNAAGASQVFTGFNNNNNQEFRFNNFATGGFIDFRIGGTSSLRIFNSRNVGINTTTDVASSQFQIDSTTKGFLPPRMTTTQKNAIASPAAGLMVYDTTLNLISVYNGTTWITL
jgi:hypothetical protein